MRRIVLPQAMRVIIPPTGNEMISMLKTTSLVVACATVTELFYAQEQIAARTYQIVPLLLVASLWYLIITSVLTVGQYYLERYYARGSVAQRCRRRRCQRLRHDAHHVPRAAAGARRTGGRRRGSPRAGD